MRDTFVRGGAPASAQVAEACDDAWDRLLFPSLEREIRSDLTDTASEQAIKMFKVNLKALLPCWIYAKSDGAVPLGTAPYPITPS